MLFGIELRHTVQAVVRLSAGPPSHCPAFHSCEQSAHGSDLPSRAHVMCTSCTVCMNSMHASQHTQHGHRSAILCCRHDGVSSVPPRRCRHSRPRGRSGEGRRVRLGTALRDSGIDKGACCRVREPRAMTATGCAGCRSRATAAGIHMNVFIHEQQQDTWLYADGSFPGVPATRSRSPRRAWPRGHSRGGLSACWLMAACGTDTLLAGTGGAAPSCARPQQSLRGLHTGAALVYVRVASRSQNAVRTERLHRHRTSGRAASSALTLSALL